MSSLDIFGDVELLGDMGVDASPANSTPTAGTDDVTGFTDISDDDACPVARVRHPSNPSDVPTTQTCNKRRKIARNSRPSMQVVPVESSMSLTCVFAPVLTGKKKNHVAVALWPQYEIPVIGNGGKVARWLVVGNYEDWFLLMTQQLAKGSRRCNAQWFKNTFNPVFYGGIQKARSLIVKLKQHEDSESDADDDDGPASGKNLRIPFSSHPLLRVTMGDFTVTCLNHGRACILQVDDDCVNFIKGFLLPLAQNSAAPSQSVAKPRQETGGTTAPFSFPTSCTPNIRDKVMWDVAQHGWKLYVKKSKAVRKPFTDASGGSLCVSSKLQVDVYEKEKQEKYVNAIVTWNTFDGSSRTRIELALTTPICGSCGAC